MAGIDPASTHPQGVNATHAKPRVGPWQEERLKVAVTAPPVDDAANEAVVELLAKTLGCKKRDIEIVRGGTSRKKTLRIRGVSADTLKGLCA